MADMPNLRIIPLGGVNEIGKNITAIEYGNDIIVVDCGSTFPGDEMPGVDLVIPDVTYLVENRDRVRGYVITHGHLDHIGAVPYILKQVPAPIFGTRLTCALIQDKLDEQGIKNIKLNVIVPRQTVTLGAFQVKFIHVNHSISGACALAITCPAGTIVHSGDFKFDYTPVDDEVTDFASLAQLGEQGVLCLMCESTNIERKGCSLSEKKVGEVFNQEFRDAQGRIIVAMFTSNTNRVQQVVDCGIRYGRKVCFVGRSMVKVSKIARDLGELRIDPQDMVEMDDIDTLQDNQVLILTTGAQGEELSGLARMAYGDHRKLQIRATDKVILSSSPIPGNEKSVSALLNQLYMTGCEVVYKDNNMPELHASGHAYQEEFKLMHALLKPRYFIPVHGEHRHLVLHALLAHEMGVPKQNIVIPTNGDVIEIGKVSRPVQMKNGDIEQEIVDGITIAGQVQAGEILVDGYGIGDVGSVVLRDRKRLSEDGLVIVAMAFDRTNGVLVSGPDIISRGFVYVRDNSDIIEDIANVVRSIVYSYGKIDGSDWPNIKNRIKDELRRFIFEKIKRSPMILPIIVDLG